MSKQIAKRPNVPTTYIVAMVPVAAALNIVGGAVNSALRLPTFLDMIGTAVVAMTLGPWWGALTGIITNTGTAIIRNPVSLPFAFVNIVGALVWGYGIRWGWGRSFLKLLGLSMLVGLLSTIAAVPIYVLVFGGATGHFGDMMTATFVGMGQELWASVFSANIIVSLTDKIISTFVALGILGALPKDLTYHVDIIEKQNMKTVVWITGGIVIGVALLIFLMTTGIAG
ncbi:MAG: ECF transporter S component [Halanaerobiaceae bacterium]